MKNWLILFFMTCLVMISVSYAQPPFQQSIATEGLILEVPVVPYLQQNQDFKFQVHVFNATNGKTIPQSQISYCLFHLYNAKGSHIIETNMSAGINGFDWEYAVLGGNFTQTGQYASVMYCELLPAYEARGGFFEYGFDVTLSGQSISLPWIIADVVLLVCMMFIMIFISMKHQKVDFELWDSKNKSETNNMGQIFIGSLLYTLFKNSFIWLYSIGWICVLILRDIVYQFSSPAVYEYFVMFANVYSVGLVLVCVFFIGMFASYLKNTLEILSDNNWGLGDGE